MLDERDPEEDRATYEDEKVVKPGVAIEQGHGNLTKEGAGKQG